MTRLRLALLALLACSQMGIIWIDGDTTYFQCNIEYFYDGDDGDIQSTTMVSGQFTRMLLTNSDTPQVRSYPSSGAEWTADTGDTDAQWCFDPTDNLSGTFLLDFFVGTEISSSLDLQLSWGLSTGEDCVNGEEVGAQIDVGSTAGFADILRVRTVQTVADGECVCIMGQSITGTKTQAIGLVSSALIIEELGCSE